MDTIIGHLMVLLFMGASEGDQLCRKDEVGEYSCEEVHKGFTGGAVNYQQIKKWEEQAAEMVAEPLPEKKTILFWTSFYGHDDYEFGLGDRPFHEAGCIPEYNLCETTKDQSKLEEADAVIFHMRNIDGKTILPERRRANQTFVFFLLENPYNQWNDLKQWNGYFNLTMTYHSDSDIQIPYGRILRKREMKENDKKEGVTHSFLYDDDIDGLGRLIRQPDKTPRVKLHEKEYMVAWFVSRCKTASYREKYVAELAKYVDVHVYGACGNYSCPEKPTAWPHKHKDCYEMLGKKYKFYLSFENAFCQDYVTEKLFNILQYDVVPVVLGGAEYRSILPERSYIDAMEFPTPRDLAERLHHLSANPKEYHAFFAWKRHHHVYITEFYEAGFCALCNRLHNTTTKQQTHQHLDLWWGKQTTCDNTRMINYLKKAKTEL